MTTYAKEYSDNSHIWMTPAKEYAEKLHRLGFTFEDFAKEHPRLAVSEYGEDLKTELQLLQDADNQAMIDDHEEQETMDTSYNGWTNKETWLVNVHYMDEMPDFYKDMDVDYVEANELEEAVRHIAEECEGLLLLPAGLLSDFINDAWSEVNWHELANHLNETLKEEAEA